MVISPITTSPFRFTMLPLEKGKIHGIEYLIRPSWVCTCAYVKVPENHPWFKRNARVASSYPDIPVNWGCTFYDYFNKPQQEWDKGCYVGWDYGHIEDDGALLDKKRVYRDIKNVIKAMEKAEQNKGELMQTHHGWQRKDIK